MSRLCTTEFESNRAPAIAAPALMTIAFGAGASEAIDRSDPPDYELADARPAEQVFVRQATLTGIMAP
jgi:hypothetical protein